MAASGWIGVDLDGTLAEYSGWTPGSIGSPVPAMVERVKAWLAEGIEVRIFTARVACSCLVNDSGQSDNHPFVEEQRWLINNWSMKHIGQALKVTATKDFAMVELWDDRAVTVKFNTGQVLTEGRK